MLFRSIATESAKRAAAYPADFYVTGAVQRALVDNINLAIAGQIEPTEALATAEKQMNSLLSKLLAD